MNNTGYIPSPKDKRDFKLSAIQPDVVNIPAVFRPDYSFLPTYHQHKQPSCIGHAVAWMINFYEWDERQSKELLSPRFIYALAKRDDGIPYEDGTYYRIGLKEVKNHGVCDESFFPNNTDLDRATYNDYKLIDVNAFADAEGRMIKAYAEVDNLSFDGLKQAIYQNKVVLLALQVDENMYQDRFGNVTWEENKILPLRLPASVDSGHAVVGIGYDEDHIYFKNSWGTTWGQKGDGYFKSNYVPYIQEAWTAVDLTEEQIAQIKATQLSLISVLKELIAMLTKAFRP